MSASSSTPPERCLCAPFDKCFCTLEQRAARREVERQLASDRKLHGYSVMGPDGERVDPLSVSMAMDEL